ncbi:MAG: hypothetical protein NZM07_01310, partial [Elioraea sp.]|nr:hypothetical protein [Elioraea sp.]
MVLKFAPLTVRFDRWTGFACPTERRLFRPEEAVLEITWKSTTGLTVVGFGVRTDAEGAVHWSRALDEEAPRWVFLKGHGAIGGPEAPAAELPLRGARLRDWIADAIRSDD